MPQIDVGGIGFRYLLEGPDDAPVVAFSNSLGATLEMWRDSPRPRRALPHAAVRHARPWRLGDPRRADGGVDLARDLAGLLDALGIGRAHLVGLSLGGMTVQALASAEPGRALSATLMATAAYMPSAQSWDERAATVRAQGTAAVVEATLGRWFTADFARTTPRRSRPSASGSSPAIRSATRCAAARSGAWIYGRPCPLSPPRPW